MSQKPQVITVMRQSPTNFQKPYDFRWTIIMGISPPRNFKKIKKEFILLWDITSTPSIILRVFLANYIRGYSTLITPPPSRHSVVLNRFDRKWNGVTTSELHYYCCRHYLLLGKKNQSPCRTLVLLFLINR